MDESVAATYRGAANCQSIPFTRGSYSCTYASGTITKVVPGPATKTKQKPPIQTATGNDIAQVAGCVTAGPCSNIQIGGTGNQATTTCEPPHRILSDKQRSKFIASLKAMCPFEIAVRPIPGNKESMEYAVQLSSAITDSGCTLKRPKFLIDTAPSYGLQIVIHDKENIPQEPMRPQA